MRRLRAAAYGRRGGGVTGFERQMSYLETVVDLAQAP
jgi:hypothetical protein